MMLRKLAIHIPKNDFRHVFTPYPIINSVWVKVLNLIGENIKLKETNIRTKLHDLGFDHGFLDMSLEEQVKKFFHQNLKIPSYKFRKNFTYIYNQGISIK